jgi:hypothetical protein
MERYYFHVALGSDLFEDERRGVYMDRASAQLHARRLAERLHGSINFRRAVVVLSDEQGSELARIHADEISAGSSNAPGLSFTEPFRPDLQ